MAPDGCGPNGVRRLDDQDDRPHLTLLHIFETDDAEHQDGPDTPEALAAIEQADTFVKQIVDAIAAASPS